MDLAFPSAHAVVVTSLYGFLAVLLARELPTPLRRLPYSVVGVWIGLVAISHLYLARHWVTDLVGGITLGLSWAGMLGIAYRRHAHQPIGALPLILIPVAALVLVGGWLAGARHQQDLERYAVRHPERVLDAKYWWDSGWVELPASRLDWEGDSGAPMSIQYAGDLDRLRQHLEARDWADPIPLTMATAILWLTPNPDLRDLPVLPQVHKGHREALLLVHYEPPGTDGVPVRLVLRLYPGDAHLAEDRTPLWVGTLIRERLRGTLGLITLPRDERVYTASLDRLRPALVGLEVRAVHRSGPHMPGWDGSLLLLRAPDSASAQPAVAP
jgi:undecaprenyl-diphosphatase